MIFEFLLPRKTLRGCASDDSRWSPGSRGENEMIEDFLNPNWHELRYRSICKNWIGGLLDHNYLLKVFIP